MIGLIGHRQLEAPGDRFLYKIDRDEINAFRRNGFEMDIEVDFLSRIEFQFCTAVAFEFGEKFQNPIECQRFADTTI